MAAPDGSWRFAPLSARAEEASGRRLPARRVALARPASRRALLSAALALPVLLAVPTAHAGTAALASPLLAGGAWQPMVTAGAPAPRQRALSVWTGTELLIWGGEDPARDFRDDARRDGAAYDPVAHTWRPLPPPPGPNLVRGLAVWTGEDMVIVGRIADALPVFGAAAYRPTTNAWRPLPAPPADLAYPDGAVWTGATVLAWRPTAAGYDPAANAWRPLPAPGFGVAFGATGVWTGRELLVWGGGWAKPTQVSGGGAAYNPATNTWRPLPEWTPRRGQAAVWTSREMVVLGGSGDNDELVPGADAYDPAANRWRHLPRQGAPSPRYAMTPVWTGRALLLWGGRNDTTSLGDGAAYDPAANAWRTLPTAGAPSPRQDYVAAWTGRQLLIWGGGVQGSYQARGDGAAYAPPPSAMPRTGGGGMAGRDARPGS